MENKRVMILVAIALILAITAIGLNAMDSEVPTVGQGDAITGAAIGGEIGLNIQPAPVEDKLVGEEASQ